MTCRHEPGDPACSSSPEGQERLAREYEDRQLTEKKRELRELEARTPNPDNYEIVRVKPVESFLVAEIQYTSCPKCEFDAKKVMVFQNTGLHDMIYWKRIDPHFRDFDVIKSPDRKVAPPPIARFPATNIGWQDALNYAKFKLGRAENQPDTSIEDTH